MNSRRLQEILHLVWRNQEPIIPMSRLWGSITTTGKMWATSVAGIESPSLSPANVGLIWTEQGRGVSKEGEKQKLTCRPQTASCLPPQAPSPRTVSQVLPTGTELWS